MAFIADDNTYLSELERLRNKLIETRKKENGEYLVNVIKEHGINADDYSCRGEIYDVGEIGTTLVDDLPYFVIGVETAWVPLPEVWEAIIDKYEGIFTVYTAEEPGVGIYINSDDQGYCFTDRFRFAIYIDNTQILSKTGIFGIGKRFSENYGESSDYFEDETGIISYFSMIMGRKFFSLAHVNDFCNSLSLVSNGEIHFSLNEFRTE